TGAATGRPAGRSSPVAGHGRGGAHAGQARRGAGDRAGLPGGGGMSRLSAQQDPMSTFRRVHFIGIGGVGMSGIAEVLHNLGYAVSGSDRANSPTAQRLARLGLVVHEGHDAANVGDADVVVTSSAIRQDNPELVAAHAARIPVIPR